MNSLIWRNLPTELIHKIVLLSDPSIDTRLYFRIPPKRFDEEELLRFEFRLFCWHDGIMYNMTSKTLHIFRVPGCHVIHRPVELDAMDEWFSVFNESGERHAIETITQTGTHVTSSNNVFYTELRVLLT